MTSNRDVARTAAARFSGRPGWPNTEEGITDLIDAFARCGSDAHCKLVADDLTVESHFCPTPAEVYRVAQATAQRGTAGCEACDFTGWRHVHKGQHTGVVPCACRSAA